MTTTQKSMIEDRCTCGLALPLRTPRPRERTMTWICTGCGASYDAVIKEHPSPDCIQHVRPARLCFKRPRDEEFPKAIAEFVAKIVPERAARGLEERASVRYPVVRPIAVMPLGDRLEQLDEIFMAITVNISRSGLAFANTRAVTTRYLAIEIPEGLQVVLQVVRCRPSRCFYEIAGRFVLRMLESRSDDRSQNPVT